MARRSGARGEAEQIREDEKGQELPDKVLKWPGRELGWPNQEAEKSDTGTYAASNASLFVKVGIVVLSIIMIIGFGIKLIPGAVTVTTLSTRNSLPIHSVDCEEARVSLSFDVAWESDDIPRILDILEQHGIKATFFLTGEWAREYPEEVKVIAAAGHDLGNHSEKHREMTRLSKEECIREVMNTHETVKKLTEVDMKLFRAPYGAYDNTLIGIARECGYDTIQWNIDSLDWKDYGVDSIIRTVIDNEGLENGSIILMHSGGKYTTEALEAVITGLQDKGYELVPVSQLIFTGEYTVDQTGRQLAK